jgi:hypothetical protein
MARSLEAMRPPLGQQGTRARCWLQPRVCSRCSGVCACRPRRDCSHSPRSTPQRLPPCRWLCHGSDWPWGCPRPGARGGGRRSVAQDPLLVPEADRAVALNDRRDVCVAVGPCVGVGDGQVGPARRANWLGHHVSQHPLPSVLLAADDHPNLLQNRSSSASTGPPPGSVITDEASPLALRSTRNRLRNQPSGRPGPGRDHPVRPTERHPRGAAGDARPARGPRRGDLLDRRHCRPGVLHPPMPLPSSGSRAGSSRLPPRSHRSGSARC